MATKEVTKGKVQQRSTGRENAQYASDLTVKKMIGIAERNTTHNATRKEKASDLEYLIFHDVSQFDAFSRVLSPHIVELLKDGAYRDNIIRHIQEGQLCILWVSSRGMKIEFS